MNRMCTFVLALGAACLSTAGQAAKPGKCSPQLLAPSGLTVESDGSTVTSTWNEVNDLAKEATKYSVEITAHYDAHGDVRFTFTAFDDDPGELDTASLTIDASGLNTTVCNNPPDCTDNTTHSATSVTVQVKALNPPSKGKEGAQCNPFSAPVTASVEVEATCPCFDAAGLAALAAVGTGTYDACNAGMTDFGVPTLQDDFVISSVNAIVGGHGAFARAPASSSSTVTRACLFSLTPIFQEVNETEYAACTALIEAAQAEVGCVFCIGPNCPP